jgi:hypothetical protein
MTTDRTFILVAAILFCTIVSVKGTHKCVWVSLNKIYVLNTIFSGFPTSFILEKFWIGLNTVEDKLQNVRAFFKPGVQSFA